MGTEFDGEGVELSVIVLGHRVRNKRAWMNSRHVIVWLNATRLAFLHISGVARGLSMCREDRNAWVVSKVKRLGRVGRDRIKNW